MWAQEEKGEGEVGADDRLEEKLASRMYSSQRSRWPFNTLQWRVLEELPLVSRTRLGSDSDLWGCMRQEIFWIQSVNIGSDRPGQLYREDRTENLDDYLLSSGGMQYSDDIEMWDFDQILDSSPLTALTADFARFKERCARIFDNRGSTLPYADSESESSSIASNGRGGLATDVNDNKIPTDATHGSSQYHSSSTQNQKKKTSMPHEKPKYYSLGQPSTNGSMDSNRRDAEASKVVNVKDTNKAIEYCTGSIPTPARRPTELAVIPHIITDEYILAMKTKGFSSADQAARPKDGIHPRLTRSYLEEYHNNPNASTNQHHRNTSTNNITACNQNQSNIHDWQFNKYQQELEDEDPPTSYYSHSRGSRHSRVNGSVRFSNDSQRFSNGSVRFRSTPSPLETNAYTNHSHRNLYRHGLYHNQDNKLIKEDSWRGPSTPYPKTATSLGATHRGTHRFTPRHPDELEIQIGDSIHVLDEAEDGWCMGINLTTQSQGIFPAVYATDLEFYEINDEVTVKQPQPKLYKLHFLGSMEVNHHKGSDVLVDAIEKIILNRRISKDTTTPPLCQLEVSEAGIKMIDLTHKKRTKKLVTDMNVDSACERLSKLLAFSKETKAVSNHFFSLKNVSFCGYHPENPRYFGFITKHPTQQRFACHCYSSVDESTQPIVDAVGDAFHNYYCEYVPFSDSSEDIYLE